MDATSIIHKSLHSAAYLRQTILLSAFETPEMRGLFNRNLKNVSGKIRTHRSWQPVEVPEGVEQVCY
jgi:U3 small nucleolar RNA-associated protein 25